MTTAATSRLQSAAFFAVVIPDSRRSLGKKRKAAPPFLRNSEATGNRFLDAARKSAKILPMKVTLPLKELTVSEKIGIMEEIWADLSRAEGEYSPPDWHDRILEERSRLADSGQVGFTDWETAKKQIKVRVS